MEKNDFDDHFKVLDKAGDRTRSVMYAFIIINIALLMYSLNVFTYPVQQYAFDDVNLQVRCRYQTSKDPKCDQVKDALAHETENPRLTDKIEQDFLDHQLSLFYDNSVALRTFKAPILGFETDRDLLWLIFPLIGMVSYYIVWSALAQLVGVFRFLVDRNQTDAMRLRMLKSILVISAPLSDERGGEITLFYQILWRVIAIVVFAIPFIVTALMIADQTNAIATFIRQVPGEKFLYQPSGTFQAELAFEAVLLLLQLGLLSKLIGLGIRFGRDQGEAERLIATLEARSGGVSPGTGSLPDVARREP